MRLIYAQRLSVCVCMFYVLSVARLQPIRNGYVNVSGIFGKVVSTASWNVCRPIRHSFSGNVSHIPCHIVLWLELSPFQSSIVSQKTTWVCSVMNSILNFRWTPAILWHHYHRLRIVSVCNERAGRTIRVAHVEVVVRQTKTNSKNGAVNVQLEYEDVNILWEMVLLLKNVLNRHWKVKILFEHEHG